MKTYTIKAEEYNITQDFIKNQGGVTINSAIVSEQTLRDLIAQNPELTQPIEEKKTKFFKPKENERYNFLDGNGIDDTTYDEGNRYDTQRVARGAYATKEEAELADQKRMAIVRLWDYADEKMYFRPDWSEVRCIYFVIYDGADNSLKVGYKIQACVQFTLPYFKSLEDAEQFIKDNKADLELLFLK